MGQKIAAKFIKSKKPFNQLETSNTYIFIDDEFFTLYNKGFAGKWSVKDNINWFSRYKFAHVHALEYPKNCKLHEIL